MLSPGCRDSRSLRESAGSSGTVRLSWRDRCPARTCLLGRAQRRRFSVRHPSAEAAAHATRGRAGFPRGVRFIRGATGARLPGYCRHAADGSPDQVLHVFDARCHRRLRRNLVDALVCALSARARPHPGRHRVGGCARGHHRGLGVLGPGGAMGRERQESREVRAGGFYRQADRDRLRCDHDQGASNHAWPQRQRFLRLDFRRTAGCVRDHNLD